MKNGLKLSIWFLLITMAMPITSPIQAAAKTKQNDEKKRKSLKKKYHDAKALYEKRKKERAPKAELDKLEKEMKKARRRYIGAIVGITAAVTAAAAATAYAASQATSTTPTPTTPTTTKPTIISGEEALKEAEKEVQKQQAALEEEEKEEAKVAQAPACPIGTFQLKELVASSSKAKQQEFIAKLPGCKDFLSDPEWKDLFREAFTSFKPDVVRAIIDNAPISVKSELSMKYSIAEMIDVWSADVKTRALIPQMVKIMQEWRVGGKGIDGQILLDIIQNKSLTISERTQYARILLEEGVRSEEAYNYAMEQTKTTLYDTFKPYGK